MLTLIPTVFLFLWNVIGGVSYILLDVNTIHNLKKRSVMLILSGPIVWVFVSLKVIGFFIASIIADYVNNFRDWLHD